MGNFFIRHWRGEYSLPVSYWLMNVVAGLLVAGFTAGAISLLASSLTFEPARNLIVVLLIFLFSVFISIWQWTGLYRSAWRYIEEPDTTTEWGYIALIMMIFAVVQTANVFSKTYFPMISELEKIVFKGDPSLPNYKVTLSESGDEILVEGGMKYGLLEDVKKLMDTAPRADTIELNSRGGREGVALDLYNLIKDAGFNTVVNNECLSACPLAFAGGVNRWLGAGASIGFHSASFPGTDAADLSIASMELWRPVAWDQDISFDFIKLHSSVPSEDMSYPSRDDLYEANFITGEVSEAVSSALAFQASAEPALIALKATLPRRLDDSTTLISAEISGIGYSYEYTVNEKVTKLYQTPEELKDAKAQLQLMRCNESMIKEAMSFGVAYDYNYLREKDRTSWVSFRLKCL